MSSAEIKISKIIELLGRTDESTLDKIIGLLGSSKSDADTTDVFPPEVIEGIAKSKKQIKNGQYTSHDTIRAKYKDLYPNANI